MAQGMMSRGTAIAAAWLSLGMVLSASSCYRSDIDKAFPDAQNLQLQKSEHWNPERQNQIALQAVTAMRLQSHQSAQSQAQDEWLWHTGRTDCPGNACDKKKDDLP